MVVSDDSKASTGSPSSPTASGVGWWRSGWCRRAWTSRGSRWASTPQTPPPRCSSRRRWAGSCGLAGRGDQLDLPAQRSPPAPARRRPGGAAGPRAGGAEAAGRVRRRPAGARPADGAGQWRVGEESVRGGVRHSRTRSGDLRWGVVRRACRRRHSRGRGVPGTAGPPDTRPGGDAAAATPGEAVGEAAQTGRGCWRVHLGAATSTRTTPAQRRAALRRQLNALVAAHHHRTGLPHGKIHAELRQRCGGPPSAQATIAQLEERIAMLRRL